MQVVSIEKLGEKIYGCLDDGISYHIFSIDPEGPFDYEESYYKSDYTDYDHFVLSYAHMDPGTCFLEAPVAIGAADKEDLTYEVMLGVWKDIWEGEG
ncbi:MAG: hypothetical protein E4H15_02090 [Syntrophobacterales bacterium]|nr:MAG: hypothetical protein E4H15_02090 [Syntrophobacterales bacterium]